MAVFSQNQKSKCSASKGGLTKKYIADRCYHLQLLIVIVSIVAELRQHLVEAGMTDIRKFILRYNASKTNIIAAGAATAAVAIIISTTTSSPTPTQAEQKKKAKAKLEVFLMDRIAKKPYLNYHSVPNAIQAKRNYRRRVEDNNASIKGSSTTPQDTRPKGVPSRLRILALDVPQFKEEAIEDYGVCRLPSEIFSTNGPKFIDGIAPPKQMDKRSTGYYYSKGESRKERRASLKPVDQKSLAKQLYYCYDSRQRVSNNEADQKQQPPAIGIEILESSIMNLNPNNIRRTYTSNSSNKMRKTQSAYLTKYAEGIADVDEAETTEYQDNVDETESQEEEDLNSTEDTDDKLNNPLENERTAPWMQYAWLEEMYLRVSGIISIVAFVNFLRTILPSHII